MWCHIWDQSESDFIYRGAKMFWNLIWKSPKFVPFRANKIWPTLNEKLSSLLSNVWENCAAWLHVLHLLPRSSCRMCRDTLSQWRHYWLFLYIRFVLFTCLTKYYLEIFKLNSVFSVTKTRNVLCVCVCVCVFYIFFVRLNYYFLRNSKEYLLKR